MCSLWHPHASVPHLLFAALHWHCTTSSNTGGAGSALERTGAGIPSWYFQPKLVMSADSSGGATFSAAFQNMTWRWARSMCCSRLGDVGGNDVTLGGFFRFVNRRKRAYSMDVPGGWPYRATKRASLLPSSLPVSRQPNPAHRLNLGTRQQARCLVQWACLSGMDRMWCHNRLGRASPAITPNRPTA